MMGEHSGTTKPFWQDALERVGWSAAYAALTTALVVVNDLDYVWVPILITGLTILKTQVARFVGKPDAAIG